MRRMTALTCVLALTSTLPAQSNNSQYTPVVPAPSYGGGYGLYGGTPGGATVEGSMMQGMASVISAAEQSWKTIVGPDGKPIWTELLLGPQRL